MFILITGGSGSGKSEFAEAQILRLSREKRIYLATMKCFDEESKKRIARHRKMRAEKQFETVELNQPINLGMCESDPFRHRRRAWRFLLPHGQTREQC